MKPIMQTACAMAMLALASGSASAQQVLAGQLQVTQDTTAGGCGDSPGEHYFFFLRQGVEGGPPGTMFISFNGVLAHLQNNDADGQFKLDNTRGRFTGTVLFASGGPPPWPRVETIKGGRYQIRADASDPDMIKINSFRASFTLRESDQPCSFVWNGVMTQARMPMSAP